MTTSTNNVTSKGQQRGKRGTSSDRTKILNGLATLDDVVYNLIEKELEPDINAGKNYYFAVVTKVLTASVETPNRKILTDLFLNQEYAIQREENASYAENSNNSIVFFHIPSLFSYMTNFASRDLAKNDLTTSDLFVFSTYTSLPLVPTDVVRVTFDDLQNFTNPIILKPNESDKKLKEKITPSVSKKIVELMKKVDTCKELQLETPTGSKITPKTLLNPGNPIVGYVGLFSDLTNNVLTAENLRRRLILTKGTAKSKSDFINGPVVPLESDKIEDIFISESSYVNFKVEIYVGDQKIKDLIESQQATTPFKNFESFVPKLATSDIKANFNFSDDEDSKKKARSIYLKLDPIDPTKQGPKSKIKKPSEIREEIIKTLEGYLSGVVQTTKFQFLDSNVDGGDDNVFLLDIFGVTPSADLVDGDVDLAIDYSKRKFSSSVKSSDSLEPIVKFFSTDKKATSTDEGKKTATPKKEFNDCGDANLLINQELYTSLEQNIKKTSYQKDNKLFKTISKEQVATGGETGFLEAAISKDLPAILPSTENEKLFSYVKEIEIISTIDEAAIETISKRKIPVKKSKGAKEKAAKVNKQKNFGRGTNGLIMNRNGKNLIKFAKAFSSFIAKNEGVPDQNVLFLPVSVFRKFKKVRSGGGVDENSRHFFNRAVDFVIYINNDPSFTGFESQTAIPKKNTFEIPNQIVYVYLLKFIKQNKKPFGTCGIGLMQNSQRRKTGYIHYEFMSDYFEPKTQLGFATPKTKKNRRWTSKPKEKDKKSVYALAFNQPNKDNIILSFVIRDTKTRLGGTIPEKLMRLLNG